MIEKEPTTTTHERTNPSIKLRTYRLVRTILVGLTIVFGANALFSYLFYTPKAHRIDTSNIELVAKYRALQQRIEATERELLKLTARDNETYRPLFGLSPLEIDATPYPKSNYQHLEGDPYSPILVETWEMVDRLAKIIYQQSTSLDKIELYAKDKEALTAAIPAIWPIDRTTLKSVSGLFGMRLHPIYKRRIMHKGIDLECNTGDPIYATGDAVVERSEQGLRRSGYGQMIMLNHGFGHKTRYAHLSERLVSVGDTVRRGDLIGLIGSTGGSTGPHLHYEVIVNGVVVDPLNYFNRKMSRDEYEFIMEQVNEFRFNIFEGSEGIY